MGLNIVAPSSFAGGSVFKPKDHISDVAFLIEPKSIARQQPNTYQGKTTYRDEVTADITVFRTLESLEKGVPDEVIKATRVVHGMLSDTLEKVLAAGPDNAVAVRLDKVPTQSGAGFVWRDLDAEKAGLVGAYAEKREEAIKAAVAEAPSF
ncbi:hypothetical protein [Actinoplanes sp. NPDC026670]|uniref:hypothetical protein n=1 Tax=Actinoplanes sp. NPDC026670 TaxID=3154700 RepID=UPI0033CD1339